MTIARVSSAPSRSPRTGSVWLVVHASPPQEHTGTPLVADGYARELARRGWRVVLVEPRPSGGLGPPVPAAEDRTVQESSSVRILHRWLPRDPPEGALWPLQAASRRDPQVVRALRRLLGSERPDLVHVLDNVDLPLALPEVARELGIPVVRSVTCAEDLCALVAPVSPRSGALGYCPAPLDPMRCLGCLTEVLPLRGRAEQHRALGLLLAKRARAVTHFWDVYDRVIFASEGFRSYFEKTLPLPEEKVRVLPMGLDLTELDLTGRGSLPGGSAAARSGSQEPGPITFLFLATGHPAKGFDTLARAFSGPVLSARQDWRLVAAGGGDRSLLGPLLDDPRVTDLGPYAPGDLPRLLAGADVGISASVFETFHRVTREYLAGGLPVLAARTFGITDVVRDGVNGLVFAPNDPGGLARGTLELLDRPALLEELRQGARRTVIRSVREEVDDLVELYGELLDRPLLGAS